MDNALRSFRKREQALRRKHVRMSQGYVTRMNRNGTIEHVPASKVGGFGLWLVSRLVLAVVIFKIMTFAWLGEASYQDHLDRLSAGTALERAGAWVMQADPVTRKLASIIMPTIG